MNPQELAARLTRIRGENRAARVVDGLGAINIPFARRNGAGGLAAAFAGDAAQSALASQALSTERERALNNAKIMRLERKVETLSSKVSTLAVQPKVSGGGRAQLTQKLSKKGFGVADSGAKLGPLQLGQAGVGLNAGFLRGHGGDLFKATIAMHVAGMGLGAMADLQQRDREWNKVKGGVSAEEKRRTIGLDIGRSATQTVAGITGAETVATGMMRIAGLTEKHSQNLLEKFYEKVFTSKEVLLRRNNAAVDARIAANREISEWAAAAFNKLDHATPVTFRLTGIDDLRAYRQELRGANIPLLKSRIKALRNLADGKTKIRSGDGG